MSEATAMEAGMSTDAAGTLSRIMSSVLLAVIPPIFAELRQAETLRVTVPLVTVGVRVVDGKGREVPGLGADDFRLYEDGVVQQIALFSNDEQPISLGILLDRSDSMGVADKLERAKNAAERLVEACHPESEFFYLPFDAGWSEAEFSQDRDRIRQDIAATKLGRGTRLFDAVQAALKLCRRAHHTPKLLCILQRSHG